MTETLEPTPTVRRGLRPWMLVVGIVAVLIVVAVIVTVVLVATGSSKFEAAVEECGLGTNEYARLGDEGRTLSLNGGGTESGGLASSQMACVLRDLDVSDAVLGQMDSTRALDGRVTGSWDDIEAVWAYHPDDGLDIILTVE